MRTLNEREILALWEAGQGRSPTEQALLLLCAVCPEISLTDAAELSLGQRDAMLLAARASLFGDTLDAETTCGHCGLDLSFPLSAVALGASEVAPPISPITVRSGELEVTLRPPNSRDLLRAQDRTGRDAARALINACVLSVNTPHGPGAAAAIPEEATGLLAAAMAQCDPLVDIKIDMACPDCRHALVLKLDVAAYFFEELRDKAEQLLYEVHALARAYGWDEQQVLSIGPNRRRYYLRAVGA